MKNMFPKESDDDTSAPKSVSEMIWRGLQTVFYVCCILIGYFVTQLSGQISDNSDAINKNTDIIIAVDKRMIAMESSRWTSEKQAEYIQVHDIRHQTHSEKHTQLLAIIAELQIQVAEIVTQSKEPTEKTQSAIEKLQTQISDLRVQLAEFRSRNRNL